MAKAQRRVLYTLSKHEYKHSQANTKNEVSRRKLSGNVGGAEEQNTLIRLLQKITAADVRVLQEGVRNVSKYFQFYPQDDKMRTDVTPPAIHMNPTGHAMHMLEKLLSKRKSKGIWETNRRCQVIK